MAARVRLLEAAARARISPQRRRSGPAYLLAYVATAVACAVFAPVLLVPFGIVAAAGTLAGLWLMRPGTGGSQRLPPGSLSLVPVRQFVDEDFLARRVDRVRPVAKTTWPTLDQPVVCVYGLRRAADLLRDDAASLRGVGIAFDPLIPAGFLRNMEPDDHGHYKRLFEQALTDDLVEARRPGLEAAAAEALAAMAAMDGDGADPRPHLLRATVTAFVPLLLGVDPASPEGRRAVEIYDGMGEFLEFQSEDSEQGRRYRGDRDRTRGDPPPRRCAGARRAGGGTRADAERRLGDRPRRSGGARRPQRHGQPRLRPAHRIRRCRKPAALDPEDARRPSRVVPAGARGRVRRPCPAGRPRDAATAPERVHPAAGAGARRDRGAHRPGGLVCPTMRTGEPSGP